MKLPRRQFLNLAVGAAALLAVSRISWAQAYPTRPVRIIAGFAARLSGTVLAFMPPSPWRHKPWPHACAEPLGSRQAQNQTWSVAPAVRSLVMI